MTKTLNQIIFFQNIFLEKNPLFIEVPVSSYEIVLAKKVESVDLKMITLRTKQKNHNCYFYHIWYQSLINI
jgi:hypothetical protein